MQKKNGVKAETSKATNIRMIDVIIATIPAIGAGIYFYGKDAIKIVLASVLTTVLCEIAWNKILKKERILDNLSSLVTGLIFAMILPTHLPVWIVVIGALFANMFVKLFFGGLNGNFMNPSAAAKTFMIASWAGIMAKPVVEATTAASGAEVEQTITLMDKFIGQASGNIGETSILALVIGGIYLLLRGVISYKATLSYLVFTFIFNIVISRDGMFQGNGIDGFMLGSIFIVGIFMVNDKATTPSTGWGQVIFSAGAALFATIFSVYGYNPEGPYYAVIFMNLFAALISYLTTPKAEREVA